METMQLLIKTQLLICRRYEQEMSRLKYPAYDVLLNCIDVPGDDLSDESALDCTFTSSDKAALVNTTVELIFRTCLLSPRNAAGLVEENGVQALANLLDLYARLVLRREHNECEGEARTSLATDDTMGGIIAYCVRILSGVAYFENGRDAIKALPARPAFIVTWRRCLDGSLSWSQEGQMVDGAIKRYALEGIAHFAMDSTLQRELVGCGVLWPLLECALSYDPTLENPPSDNIDQDDVGTSVAAINIAARHSVRALGLLSGLFGTGPKFDELVNALDGLLTPPIARMLRNQRTGVILRVLNSNVERADIIWNVQMRQQLSSFISERREGEANNVCRPAAEELSYVSDFEYDALKTEVRIGGVYVRFFNKDGKEGLRYVDNPSSFLNAIVNFVAASINQSEYLEKGANIEGAEFVESASLSSPNFLSAVNALCILCRADGLVDDLLLKSPGMVPSTLLSLLELPLQSEVSLLRCLRCRSATYRLTSIVQSFSIAGDILYSVCSRKCFADAVAMQGSLWRIIRLLERPEPNENGEATSEVAVKSNYASQNKVIGWSVFEALCSSVLMVSNILSTTAWLELLGILVGYSKFTKVWIARLGAAKTLSRLLWMTELAG
jgi:hypothetical protein